MIKTINGKILNLSKENVKHIKKAIIEIGIYLPQIKEVSPPLESYAVLLELLNELTD